MENHTQIIKYPSTKHLEGSSLQKEDSPDVVPFSFLKNKLIFVEEKIDGANCGISFSNSGELLMQSRGHYLLGKDKKHFDLFKQFCLSYENELFDALGNQYIMYGEWMYALHSIYYDKLPSYFMEFDIYDKFNGKFLSTPKRMDIPEKIKSIKIHSVPVLSYGYFENPSCILDLITKSLYISDNAYKDLEKSMKDRGYDEEVIKSLLKLNRSATSEGLYIKLEDENETVGRFKFVRSDFTQTILNNDLHWNERPIIQNKLSQI